MARFARAVLSCAVLWAALPAAPARAQEPDRHAIDSARDHMDRGQELFVAGRFAEAAAEFEHAYDAQPFAAFLYNAGVAYERAHLPGRAADYFTRYLDREPSAVDAAAVRLRIDRLRTAAVGDTGGTQIVTTTVVVDGGPRGEAPDGGVPAPDAGPPPPLPDAGATPAVTPVPTSVPQDFKSLLSVQTNPPGATVTVRQGDHVVQTGSSPFGVTLEQGEYRIVVSHPQFRTAETVVRVHPGKVFVVIVEMSQGEFLGFLRVLTNVPGADVFMDDHGHGAVGRTPFQNAVATGRHHMWIERAGYRAVERDLEVSAGEDVTLQADLERQDHGRLRVVANVRGGHIFVDEHDVGTVPWEGDVAGGPHLVRVEGDGMKPAEARVTIRNGQVTPMRARLRPDEGRSAGWVSAVSAVFFLGGGVVAGVVANDLSGTLTSERAAGRLVSNDPRLLQGTILSAGADVSFGVGAILAILAVYYFVREQGPPSETTVLDARDWAFLPVLRDGGGGGALVGSF